MTKVISKPSRTLNEFLEPKRFPGSLLSDVRLASFRRKDFNNDKIDFLY